MDNSTVANLQDLDKTIIRSVKADIEEAENYQTSVVQKTVKERYEIYYADKSYYNRKFPRLSKVSSLVSTDVNGRYLLL